MSSDTNESIKDLDGCLCVRDGDGHVVLQVALLVTLYFAEPYRREKREAVLSCCEDYYQWCGEHLRWAASSEKKNFEPFGRGKATDHQSFLIERGEKESYFFICHGAEHEQEASAFHVRGLGAERRPYELIGYFKVSFPLLWLVEGPASLPEVVQRLCAKLRPISGYAGIGVVESPDNGVSSRYAPIVYEWAQRLPGLEVDYPIEHSIWLTQGRDGGKGGIKGVNWLTVIGDRWIEEIGGASEVEGQLAVLDNAYSVRSFPGGLIVQAGERPQLGDAAKGRWPELYVKLAKYLKPIRITRHCPFQYDGPGVRFDLERSKAWLRRFDDR